MSYEPQSLDLTALVKIMDSFTQLGLEMCGSAADEDRNFPEFRWAIAGPHEASTEFLCLKRQLDQLTRGFFTAQQLGCTPKVHASPSLIEVSEDDLGDSESLLRFLTKRTRLLVCISPMLGPEETLVKACLERPIDLVIADPYAHNTAGYWHGSLQKLACCCGTRVLLLRGLTMVDQGARTEAAVKAARTLLDPIRSHAVSVAGVHECFLKTFDSELKDHGKPSTMYTARL
jgi:hypothetical protein